MKDGYNIVENHNRIAFKKGSRKNLALHGHSNGEEAVMSEKLRHY
jgi:hypothetical protein